MSANAMEQGRRVRRGKERRARSHVSRVANASGLSGGYSAALQAGALEQLRDQEQERQRQARARALGLVGTLTGMGIGAMGGNPMLGAQLGGMAGGALGGGAAPDTVPVSNMINQMALNNQQNQRSPQAAPTVPVSPQQPAATTQLPGETVTTPQGITEGGVPSAGMSGAVISAALTNLQGRGVSGPAFMGMVNEMRALGVPDAMIVEAIQRLAAQQAMVGGQG